MKLLEGFGPNKHRVVISLCDYSGHWPMPWHAAGHTVLLYDLKHGDDVTKLTPKMVRERVAVVLDIPFGDEEIECVLCAPLCTAFTKAAALHWKRHDADGTTDRCVQLCDACLNLVEALEPRVWALENPRGRIQQLCPRVGPKAFEFDPCDYAGYVEQPLVEPTQDSDVETLLACNRYTKMTAIWGRCKKPPVKRLPPIVFTTSDGSKRGSVVWWKLGGKSERTKEIRSTTPMGFACAFYSANGCG